MTDPLEKAMAALLDEAGIPYVRPEIVRSDPTTLDFYLPTIDLYVELKQWHSPRLADQIAKVPVASDVMILIGRNSVDRLKKLIAAYDNST